MKKFISDILRFSLLIIAVFIGINYILKYNNLDPPHYSLQYDEVVNKIVEANAIILGTSHATHSIRPSLLDNSHYKFYNFALNGSNSTYYLNWYRKYFSIEYPKPKLCIISVDWFLFDEKWLWRDFEKDSEYFPSKLFLSLLMGDSKLNKKELLLNRFPFFKYRESSNKQNSKFFLEDFDKGFIPFYRPFNLANFTLSQKPNSIVNLSLVEIANFKKLIQILLSDKINLIFVMTPEYGLTKEDYKNSESLDFIYTVSKKYNIPFINFNTTHKNSAISDNVENFTDWGHMSKIGSIKFSKLLKKELDKIYKQKHLWK
ncbi:MAG: hypothetical protein PF638_14995 [Candidatus Delongbacteria bacterium]|jgi:hypothetical protein|nr:hypothetical protein [Candidatus Delongbacteria bacterium]